MSTVVAKPKAMLFAGKLYASFLNAANGTFSPPQLLQCPKFEIQPTHERLEAISNQPETYGQPYFSMSLPQPTEFTVEFGEVDRRLFAALFAASIEALGVAATPFTDVEITPIKGEWVSLGRRHIKPEGFTAKDDTGDVTYVRGADYEIDYDIGLLRWIGSTAPAKIEISGTTEAVTGSRLNGAQQYDHIIKLELNGVNLATGEKVLVSCPYASVSADAATDLMQRQLAVVSLTGRLQVPPSGGLPYSIDWLDRAA